MRMFQSLGFAGRAIISHDFFLLAKSLRDKRACIEVGCFTVGRTREAERTPTIKWYEYFYSSRRSRLRRTHRPISQDSVNNDLSHVIPRRLHLAGKNKVVSYFWALAVSRWRACNLPNPGATKKTPHGIGLPTQRSVPRLNIPLSTYGRLARWSWVVLGHLGSSWVVLGRLGYNLGWSCTCMACIVHADLHTRILHIRSVPWP